MSTLTRPAATQPSSGAPGPIDPTETFHFVSRDGTGLYGEWFASESPRAAALVVHGYAEHCGRYRELAHVLVNAGLAVLTYDMRGHGRADGQRGYVQDFGDYLDDLHTALERLDECVGNNEHTDPIPKVLIGHSNGGLITLRALTDESRRPEHIAAAVVSSPFLALGLKISPFKDFLGRMAGRWLPTLSLPNELPIEHLTSDPAKQEERRLDTLCHDVASARWYTSCAEAQAHVAAYAPRVDVPTLWLVSGSDRIADPAASRRVQVRLGTSPTYHEFPELEHEVFNERGRGVVFNLLKLFLEEKFPT